MVKAKTTKKKTSSKKTSIKENQFRIGGYLTIFLHKELEKRNDKEKNDFLRDFILDISNLRSACLWIELARNSNNPFLKKIVKDSEPLPLFEIEHYYNHIMDTMRGLSLKQKYSKQESVINLLLKHEIIEEREPVIKDIHNISEPYDILKPSGQYHVLEAWRLCLKGKIKQDDYACSFSYHNDAYDIQNVISNKLQASKKENQLPDELRKELEALNERDTQ
jgi:hypothetical protein